MEFRILGPLEVLADGRHVDLGGQKPRALLACLILHANQVVSIDRLIDALWEELPPDTAQKALQVYVSQLRKALGAHRIETRPPGYCLRVDEEELDLARFERLVEDRRPVEALALWRGPPLADLSYHRFAQIEIGRLDELRLAAREARIDQDLAGGRHTAIAAELESLVSEYPLRERLRGQLMLVLYRSGRQAEALEVYHQGRRLLSEELGLEPGEELKQLERAILRHAPDLIAPTGRLSGAGPSQRAILVVPWALSALPALIGLAGPLADGDPARELIVTSVVPAEELSDATASLGACREDLLARGLAARTAAFASPTPGADVVRLASQQDVELLLMDAGDSPLGGEAVVVLEQAPCDVALLLSKGGTLRPGAVIVPFGAAEHDWAALELGAWVARATGAPLRLVGAASDDREDGRDASRLLADASLIVQRTAGIVAEPLLASPGREGVIGLSKGAGLLVVGLSERWRQDGLGRVRTEIAASPPAPTVLVRRGARPGGLAPAESRTRFTWSMTSAAR